MASIRPHRNKDGKIVSYEIRVLKGKTPSGKQLNPYVLTWKVPKGMSEKKIEKEVNLQATMFEQKCKQGLVAEANYTFEIYSKIVLSLKLRTGVKHSTIERYKELLVRINLIIGHLKLTDIRPQHLNNLYVELSKPGLNKNTGGLLSNKTILEHHRIISTIFKQAEKEMLVPYNPASKATPPKREKKEAKSFQISEVKSILNSLELEHIKWKTLVHMLLFTGARRGEILGLKWANVHWGKKRIRICNNLLYSAEIGIYETSPKNDASIRYIPMSVETVKLLKEYHAWYLNEKEALGSHWEDNDLVFVKYNGGPMHPDSITDFLSKFSKRHNLPHISPHSLRHTAASILIASGMDMVNISKILGHTNVTTTIDIYCHQIKEAQIQSVENLADLILR